MSEDQDVQAYGLSLKMIVVIILFLNQNCI